MERTYTAEERERLVAAWSMVANLTLQSVQRDEDGDDGVRQAERMVSEYRRHGSPQEALRLLLLWLSSVHRAVFLVLPQMAAVSLSALRNDTEAHDDAELLLVQLAVVFGEHFDAEALPGRIAEVMQQMEMARRAG